jgi:hypothetical protein
MDIQEIARAAVMGGRPVPKAVTEIIVANHTEIVPKLRCEIGRIFPHSEERCEAACLDG